MNSNLLSNLSSPEVIESIIGKQSVLEEILEIKNYILETIDFDSVLFSKNDIRNINSSEVLSLILYNNQELDLISDKILVKSIIQENYQLKELSGIIKNRNNTNIDIDFNNLNQGDIPKILEYIREELELLEKLITALYGECKIKCDLSLKDIPEEKEGTGDFIEWISYKTFLKQSTIFHKNISNKTKDEKVGYIIKIMKILQLLELFKEEYEKDLNEIKEKTNT